MADNQPTQARPAYSSTGQHPGAVAVPEHHTFPPEQLVTPPSCPPLVGGFGVETPEAAEAREAAGLPKPPALKYGGEQSHQAPARHTVAPRRSE